MRYLPANNIKQGAVLAYPLYGQNCEVWLGEGARLTDPQIYRIQQMGYAGIYVEDELSQGIRLRDLLPPEVRLATVRAAKSAWELAETQLNSKSPKAARARMDGVFLPVIRALHQNPERLVELIDLKPEEDYIYFHTANGVVLSLLIGLELGLTASQLYELGLAALFHDVGTIFMPRWLLDKPGRLTSQEFDTIKEHSQMGFEYLRDNFEISIEGCLGALHHHENFDGSGYPNGLAGNRISLYGRIIAVADVYDALTSSRPYRAMLQATSAMEYLRSMEGIMFDPEILDAFGKLVPLYPCGSCVELNTGAQGIVVRNYRGHPRRPRIRLFSGGKRTVQVDLHADQQYEGTHVQKVLSM